MSHHNMVIKLVCTCAILTPVPRFQGSSSLCPSPFNCKTRNIKRHLPFSTFFLFIFLSIPLTLLSLTLHHSASLHFVSFFQYFPSSLSLYSLYPEPLLFTLRSFLLSFFHSSFLLPLF